MWPTDGSPNHLPRATTIFCSCTVRISVYRYVISPHDKSFSYQHMWKVLVPSSVNSADVTPFMRQISCVPLGCVTYGSLREHDKIMSSRLSGANVNIWRANAVSSQGGRLQASREDWQVQLHVPPQFWGCHATWWGQHDFNAPRQRLRRRH